MKELVNLVPIANYVQTKYHIQELLDLIDALQTEFFKKQRSPVDIITKDVPFPLSDALKKLAANHQADLNDNVEANMFFEKLRDAIHKLPILTISLGFLPSLELINEINTWVVTNVKGFVSLDFVEDKSLIAGAVVSFNGKTRDYSIKKQTTNFATIQNADITVRNKE